MVALAIELRSFVRMHMPGYTPRRYVYTCLRQPAQGMGTPHSFEFGRKELPICPLKKKVKRVGHQVHV